MLSQGLQDITGLIGSVKIKDFVDIALVTIIIYQVIKLVRDTRAIQLLKGIIGIILTYFAADIIGLNTIRFIMMNLLQIGAVAVLIMFQPELRRALEHVGRTKLNSFLMFGGTNVNKEENERLKKCIAVFCDASESLSKQKTGALIVFEKQSMLGEIAKTGTFIDAMPSYELINNVFFHNSPLHDGAMIVRNGRIYAAGCFLPLSENYGISKQLGTRHRAALGMSENSDAIILVISEETGGITIAKEGKLYRNLSLEQLKQKITSELVAPPLEEKTNKIKFKKTKENK